MRVVVRMEWERARVCCFQEEGQGEGQGEGASLLLEREWWMLLGYER